MPRRTPYTMRGIARVACAMPGCRNPAHATWQVCADGRIYRALCAAHDVELNALVLGWIKDPDRVRKILAYQRKVARQLVDRASATYRKKK